MILPDHLSIPESPSQINSDFLTSIFRTTGVLDKAAVTRIDIEPLVSNSGFNAQLARLHLAYSHAEAHAPQSLIAKLPTVNIKLQQNAAIFRPGAKECWFYRHAAARTPLNIPHCYYNMLDPATGESFLLLEDLAPARTGSRVEGTSLDHTKLALQSLARLHATWRGVDTSKDPELTQLMDNSPEAQNLVEHLYHKGWSQFLERSSFPIPADVRQFGEHLVGRVSALEALLDLSHQTLIHGDFRLENMLFGTRQGQPACWVIDWEDISLSNGMLDAAWFLGGCLPVEMSHSEEELLRWYHQTLVSAGVEGYSWSQCYQDYRYAMISSFVQGILTVASLTTNDDYARNLGFILAERFMAACRRLRLSELLPA